MNMKHGTWWKGVAALLAFVGVFALLVAPGTAQAKASAGTDIVIDDVDSRWSYSAGGANDGGWDAGGSGTAESTEHWANTVGASVDISFEGTGFELYGIKAPNHRYISVQIDEGKVSEVDCYAKNRQGNQRLYAAEGLKSGSHIAHVKVLDKSNPDAKNVLGASLQYAIAKGVSLDPNRDIVSRIEVGTQTDAQDLFAWNFEGEWTYGNTHPEMFSGADEIYSSDKSASATLYFEGTKVKVGGTLDAGHSVYEFALDGKKVGTFDAGKTDSRKHKQTLFESADLENAKHTLVITNVGSKTVQLDFADVTHKPVKPTSIELSVESLTLEGGQEREVECALKPAIADPAAIVWTTSDEKVATVEDGVVSAKSVTEKSTATITATVEGTDVSASVDVTVCPKVKDFNAFVGGREDPRYSRQRLLQCHERLHG